MSGSKEVECAVDLEEELEEPSASTSVSGLAAATTQVGEAKSKSLMSMSQNAVETRSEDGEVGDELLLLVLLETIGFEADAAEDEEE